MNKSTKTTTKARHFYAEAYTNYLRSGNLEDATRQVAHELFLQRRGAPGDPQHDWREAERITADWPATITEASHAHLYDKATAKTRVWLKELGEELGYSNPNEAYRALRAVLHAVRDRLPVEECANFASQLPTLIMGIYYTGWTPVNKPVKIRSVEDFLYRVSEELPPGTDPLRVTNAVFRLLDRHISKGEMKDVRSNFPERLRALWGAGAQTR
jgi:uncharacterized protein (DUF2267 family)